MEEILTVLIQTSPIPSHPSLALLEALFKSFQKADGLLESNIVILCDGCEEIIKGQQQNNGDSDRKNEKENHKHGKASQETAKRYRQQQQDYHDTTTTTSTCLANIFTNNILSRLINISSPPPIKIWTVTPNSTGLLVDAMIFQHYLGSELAMLEDAPPHVNNNNIIDCVYLFLEVTPTNPHADKHSQWDDFLLNGDDNHNNNNNNNKCRVMAMVNTDQFTTAILTTPRLELLLCKTRQCVEFVQEQQDQYLLNSSSSSSSSRSEPSSSRNNDNNNNKHKIPILYMGFTSSLVTTDARESNNENNDKDLERYNRFLHVAGQR